MKLKELPKVERPRERLIKYGVANLSNEDLISILIRTGSKENNVKELSSKILSKIKNINFLKDLSVRELMSIKGVGEAKALTIISAIELGKRVNNLDISERIVLNSSKMINSYFNPIIALEKQENFLVILEDNKGRLIDYKIMFKGSDTASLVDIKEVLNYAIKNRANRMIIMHNHPSGDVRPSKEDTLVTNRLSESGAIIGIPLVDHIITAGDNYYSFYEELHEN